MKYILYIISILFSLNTFSQVPEQYIGVAGNRVVARGQLKADSLFLIAIRDSTGSANVVGALIFKTSIGNPLYFDGTKWSIVTNKRYVDSLIAVASSIPLTYKQVPFGSIANRQNSGQNFTWDSITNSLSVGSFTSSTNGIIVVGGSGTGTGRITGGGGSLIIEGGDLTVSSNPTHFINFKTNNVERGRIYNSGKWEITDSLKFTNVILKTADTLNFKGLVSDATGNIFRMNWPASGSVTQVNSGFGITGGPITTTGTLLADTTRTTGLPSYFSTDSTIKAIKNCIWPDEKPLGFLYNKSSWSDTLDFISHGNAYQVLNGDNIELRSTTTGSFGDYLTVGTPSMLQAWNMKVRFRLTAWGATSFGIGVGLHWFNSANQFDLLGTIGLTTAGTTALNVYKSNVTLEATGGTFTYTLNDVIELEANWNLNVMTITATNITAVGSPVVLAKTYATPTDGPGKIPNTCNFAIYTFGGSTLLLQRVQINSAVTQNPSFMALGDSKTQGFYANSWTTRWIDAINASFPTTTSHSGEGDRTVEVIGAMDEIWKLNPRRVIMNIGSNDYRSGRTTSQVIATYDSIVRYLISIGVDVFHIVMPEDTVDFPGSAVGMTALKNYIAATYGIYYIPQVWDTLADNDNRLKSIYDHGDGIHLNQAGNDITSTVLINTGKLSVCAQRYAQFNTVNQNLRIYGDSLAAAGQTALVAAIPTLNQVLTAGNTSAIKAIISGVSSTTPKLEVESVLTQPFAADNAFVSNNVYFNGSNQVRKSTGYGSLFQFFNGQVLIATAGTGSAGSTVSLTYPFKVDNLNGGTGYLGGNISSTLNDGTGALVKVTGTQVGVGILSPATSALMHISRSQNGLTTAYISNPNTNTSARAGFIAGVSATDLVDSVVALEVLGTNWPVSGPLKQKTALLEANAANFVISQFSASEPIQFVTGASRTEALRINSGGELQIGTTTDQGAFKLQNTGGLYQNGTFSLNGTLPAVAPIYVLFKNSDSTVRQLASVPIANGGTGLAALGTANQLLRVNALATALEYFTPTFVSTNIYTASGNLTSNRTVDGSEIYDLIFNNLDSFYVTSLGKIIFDGVTKLNQTLEESIVVSAAGTVSMTTAINYVASGTTATFSLPTGGATILGRVYKVKNRGSGSLTIDVVGGSATIYDTAPTTTHVVAAGSSREFIWDGTYWLVKG